MAGLGSIGMMASGAGARHELIRDCRVRLTERSCVGLSGQSSQTTVSSLVKSCAPICKIPLDYNAFLAPHRRTDIGAQRGTGEFGLTASVN